MRMFWRRLLLICCLGLCVDPLAARSWQEIRQSGRLIVLTAEPLPGEEARVSGLHRVMMPIDRERAILTKFAAAHQLELEYVKTVDFASLFTRLKAGQGDLVSSNLAATPQRSRDWLLSAPFDVTREVVFASADSGIRPNSIAALAGKTGALLPGTTYVENFRVAAAQNPQLQARVLPVTLSHDELIEQVAVGRLDYSVLNECDLDAFLAYRPEIRKLFPIRHQVPLVFAARKDATELMAKLNRFIPAPAAPAGRKLEAKQHPGKTLCEDLDVIRRRGYLRVLTTNELFCCYLQKGQLCGFEYELAKRFAEQYKLRILTVIPARFGDLPRYLAEGKGDLIAANVTLTPERVRKFPDMTFCAPYGGVTQVLVGRPGEKIHSAADLAGRKVHVRRASSGYETLQKLRGQGIDLQIVEVDRKELMFHTLKKVSDGVYDFTVADDTFLRSAVHGGMRLQLLLELSPKQPFSWVVRKENPQLAAAVRKFFQKEHRSIFYNLCYRRYYGARKARQRYQQFNRSGTRNTISPYDAIFRKYGEIYHISWYFLAAQAYQESHFDTKRINHIGAAGLMQVMPATARELKIVDLTNPDSGVRAGAHYLAMQRSRFEKGKQIRPLDQLCFALASYNAGYGHVADARLLAAKKGWDPNVWFNQTERALALLEEPRYAARAKFGYCRASETIPYVRNIIAMADSYRKMLKVEKENLR